MVNISSVQIASLLTYNLTSIAYKPAPNWTGTVILPNATSTLPLAGNGSKMTKEASVVPYDSQNVLQGNSMRHSGNTSDTASDSASGNASSTTSSSCSVAPYDAPPIGDQEFPPYDQTTANVYRYRQQRSVNLGSWFVHENWMTPSLFSCAGGKKLAEIDIANGWGSPAGAQAALERHWDTFINESDFQYLASIGINTVRIPLGYWNLGSQFTVGTPFASIASVYANSWPRVVRAVNQAEKVGLGVLLDLHGAVGSQNGQPHSGVSDGQTGLFASQDNIDKTIAVLTFLAERFSQAHNIVGIQILNEPVFDDGLIAFYIRAIDAIRRTTPNAMTLPLYLHDGFQIDRFSDFVANRTDFVVQDHHSYFVFSPDDQKESATQHTVDVEGAIAQSLHNVSRKVQRNLVVDEWSCALTPQSLENNSDVNQARKDFCTEQMRVYANATAGWSFWAYKKEDCVTDPGWCFTAAVGKSLPHTFFTFKHKKAGNQKGAYYNPVNDTSDTIFMPTMSMNLLNTIGIPREAAKPGQPSLAHRFYAIHNRRDNNNDTLSVALNQSSTRGYTDGMNTANIFATYLSELGFISQFIRDAIRVAGPQLIEPGTEHAYHSGFVQGLKEGETIAKSSQ